MQNAYIAGSSSPLNKQDIVAIAVLVPVATLVIILAALHIAAKRGLRRHPPGATTQAAGEQNAAGAAGRAAVQGKTAGVQVHVTAS